MSELISKSVSKKLNQYNDMLKQIKDIEKEIDNLEKLINKKKLEILFLQEALNTLSQNMIKEAKVNESNYIKAIKAGNIDITKIILIEN